MKLPTIGQYVDSLSHPFGLFRTLKGFEAERDMYGEISVRSGNNAAVFRMEGDGSALALKCYIKQSRFADQIYDYIENHPSPLLASGIRRLRKELYVYDHCECGCYYDVTVSEWVEGESLDRMIRYAVQRNDRTLLQSLAERFDTLALTLLGQEWAHGDLKPENIIVRNDGTLVLIDCDAMFIPSLAGKQTSEVGTLNYQHPLRDTSMFNKHIDDYSIVLISASLHALALDPALYHRFNNSDNIIFSPAEILTEDSPAYEEVIRIAIETGDLALIRMTRALKSPTPVIDNIDSLLPYPAHDTASLSQLFLFRKSGKWGYNDITGQTIIEPIFEDATEFREGLAAVRISGKWQFIDTRGHVRINCDRYECVQSFHEGRAAVKRNGLWGYIDTRGTEIVPPLFEIASALREGMAVAKENGLYGYIDRNGEWIISPQFEYAISFRDGKAKVQKETKIYQIDKSGRSLYVIG